MNLTDDQRTAVETETSVAVTAGAGTGKTLMLAGRYLYHLREEGMSPLQIVAITFTRLAARELRARIRRTVTAEFPDRPEREDLIAELEAAQISTIHALCARICRDHPVESEAPHGFEVIEDSQDGIIAEEWLLEALDTMPPEVYDDIPFSLLETILEALLRDPVTGERAIRHGPELWPALSKDAISGLRTEFNHDPGYRQAKGVIGSYHGLDGDLAEAARQSALEATLLIDTDRWFDGLEILSGMNLRGGSEKKWPAGGMQEVKGALKGLKATARDQLNLIAAFQPGPHDERFAAMLPSLKRAFKHAVEHIRRAKHRTGQLDYNDLEVCALRALGHESVREYYRARWKAFLIDEFQDTNPVQAEIISLLADGCRRTVVGDEKQSIYGFRRAEVEVFRRVKHEIEKDGGPPSALSVSFRAHAGLTGKFNLIFDALLRTLHQPLTANRVETPHDEPHIRFLTITSEDRASQDARRRTEARIIAELIIEVMTAGTMVHDAERNELRPVRYDDIAILSRAWDPLDVYAEALSSRGIPAVHMGGGDLLRIREARDAVMLLRFLADRTDDLALAAVLRSPFFAVSDRDLFDFAQRPVRRSTWWEQLGGSAVEGIERPARVLGRLLEESRSASPSRLLQLADRLTGYSAVIANLPGAARRLADWNGMLDLIRSIEEGCGYDLFSTVRRLLGYEGTEVERPKIEGAGAVKLMTIHGAKGLEWPIVIVPDLARRLQIDSRQVLFDQHRGIGIRFSNEDGDSEKTVLHSILQREQQRKDEDEARRLLYVAITRARDSVFLTASDEKGGYLKYLLEGLDAAGIEAEKVAYDPRDGLPFEQPVVNHDASGRELLTDPVGIGMRDLPVTALTDYARCPAMFRFRHVENHPGLGEGSDRARRIGRLTHKALELEIDDADRLARHDSTLERKDIEEALDLARRFRVSKIYAPFREATAKHEEKVRLRFSGITLHGVIDLLGDDFVLDYKTDNEIEPGQHRFQLWAYARASGRKTAHIAWLRHDQVHTFNDSDLAGLEVEIDAMARSIVAGRFEATPSQKICETCPYAEICADSFRVTH
ncbi:MAG: UvrD-helicase domain-containing protein [Acidobacteriota bacterium]|nr:MAG: UvrD-helicase domain-containing protein [Acidobacteriota bacterium]